MDFFKKVLAISLFCVIFTGFGYLMGAHNASAHASPTFAGRFQPLQEDHEALDTKTGKVCAISSAAEHNNVKPPPGFTLVDSKGNPNCSDLEIQ